MPSKKEIEAGRAFVRLFLKNDMSRQLAGALKAGGAQFKSFGRGAMVAGAGVTAAGTAILAPLAMAVRSFASQGDTLDKMAKRTGIAGAALAEFSFAAEQSGTELESFEKGIKRMQRTLTDAELGLSSAIDGLDMVGLKVKELQGLSPEEQFQKIADGMAAIEDPSKKAAAAQMLFGRAGPMLIPMLDDLRALRQEARELGIIPSQDEIDNAAKVTDAINRVRRAVKAMFFNVGAGLAKPALQFLGVLKGIAVSVGKFARNKGPILLTVAAIGSALVVAGATVTAFGIALFSAGVALSALGSVVGVLLSPIGLITAAVVGGAAAWLRYSESGKRAWASLKAAVMPIIDTLKTTFGGVQDALISGDWELAGKVAMAGLKLAVLQGLSAIQKAFPKTFGTVLRVFGKIGDGIVMVWSKVTGFLTDQWNSWGKQTLGTVLGVAGRIPQIWQKAVEGMANWMLETSAKGGVMGKAMSKMLGVDMGEEQAKAELTERKRRESSIRLKTEEIAVLQDELKTGALQNTGEKITPQDREAMQRQLERTQAELADLKAGGSGTADGGTVDVLADAREAVKQYTESLIGNARALGGKPGAGKVSESLEAFLTKLESGAGTEEAAKELAALREEVAKRKAEEAKARDVGGSPAPGGGPVMTAAPRGVALTATYSAAAAQIAGYQPSGGPEKKMADGITAIERNTKEMTTLQQEFLAGWRVA